MSSTTTIEQAAVTLSFDAFWGWLQTHPNCILRAGTLETVVYDDDDLHWHFAIEGVETRVVELMRGKRLVGEIVVTQSDVSYVQQVAGDEDEYVFELISETETDRTVAYYFVLSHGYEAAQEAPTPGRAVH